MRKCDKGVYTYKELVDERDVVSGWESIRSIWRLSRHLIVATKRSELVERAGAVVRK